MTGGGSAGTNRMEEINKFVPIESPKKYLKSPVLPPMPAAVGKLMQNVRPVGGTGTG